MGSACMAAYRDDKGDPSASLTTLDLIEPLIVLQTSIITILNLACLEKRGSVRHLLFPVSNSFAP